MQGWFPSANHHSVQLPRAFDEEVEKSVFGYQIRAVLHEVFGENELGIVTVSASEITAGSPGDCREFFRVIEERHQLYGRYLHDLEYFAINAEFVLSASVKWIRE